MQLKVSPFLKSENVFLPMAFDRNFCHLQNWIKFLISHEGTIFKESQPFSYFFCILHCARKSSVPVSLPASSPFATLGKIVTEDESGLQDQSETGFNVEIRLEQPGKVLRAGVEK